MADANRGEASRCLDIARSAAANHDFEKAQRFVEKSMRLYPCDEARKVSASIKRQQSNGQSSSSRSTPPGMDSSAMPNGVSGSGLHSRRSTAAAPGRASAATQPAKPDTSTPEQKSLVRRICATKDYYEMLSVEKTAGDDELKRAYKKLALKLHPDKNSAPGSEQAFKAVSRAYACLSDTDKRAAYDRFGSEDPQQVGGFGRGGFGGGNADTFDPNEIFNMFFGGANSFGGVQSFSRGQFGPRTRVYSTGFGGGNPFMQHAQQRARGAATGPATTFAALLQLIPILLLLLFSFWSSQSSPEASLAQQGEYRHGFSTARHHVPYWVKSSRSHMSNYPEGSSARARLDESVEGQYREQLEQLCQRERVAQMQAARWSRRRAQAMRLDHCEELSERFGYSYNSYSY